MASTRTLPRGLGYFSLGLAGAQLLAPGALSRLIGLRGGRTSTASARAIGVRELAAGAGILSQSRPGFWLWARVAGDAMDLCLLGAAMFDSGNQRGRVAAALASVGALTVADVYSAREMSEIVGAEGEPGVLRLVKAVTIRGSVEDVYGFWRDFRNFPSFMSHLESVAVLDERRSHWTARGPLGRHVEWDAEIVEDVPNEHIRWRSLPGATVSNNGTVRFTRAPGDRGTEVHLRMDYAPPAAELGSLVARVFGQEPAQQVQADLRKVKQVFEAGEVVRSSATLAGTHIAQRPAQPIDGRAGVEARS